ncbi:AAA family ATPase [Mycolicibacterium litorale]|uniref:AAA family ATPase n=1 Tax=Mycolicibacterium litorale TaxID=758802 RepID=UPI0039A2744F
MTLTTTDRNGSAPGGPTDSPFNNPKVAEKLAAERQVKGAAEAREKRLKGKQFAVSELAARPEPWARYIVRERARYNAMLDTSGPRLPSLLIDGSNVARAGASDAEIAGLHELSNDEITALRMEAAALREASRIRVRDRARSIIAERAAVAPPEPISLTGLLDQPDEDAAYRVEGLWPAGGRVLFAGQYKTGKSTASGNTIKSLVDGVPLFGRFDVVPVDKVVLIDTELDPRTLRKWLRDQNISNTDAVTVVPLRGAVSSFDILDPARRAEWAQRLAGADVVIFDCIRPLIDALGLSEDKDAGKVLVAFDALLAEIGAGEGMVITHMGHQNGPASERARGDSRLLDWPDALWKIVRGGDDTDDDNGRPRFFSALGRDVAVAEGRFDYDAATRHLTYEGGSRRESADRAAVPELLAMVTAAPGKLSKRQAEARLIDEHGVTQRAARAAISAALRDRSVVVTTGARKAQLLSPAAVFPPPANPDFTASEGLK